MMGGTGLMSGDRKIVAPGSSGVRLTQREEQIARLLSLGYQHKKIAHIIGISANTVS